LANFSNISLEDFLSLAPFTIQRKAKIKARFSSTFTGIRWLEAPRFLLLVSKLGLTLVMAPSKTVKKGMEVLFSISDAAQYTMFFAFLFSPLLIT
jgi:hypothetical protein